MSSQLLTRRAGLALRPGIGTRIGAQALAIAVWLILPVLCVLMLVVGTQKLSKHLNNVPPGTMGTYRVTSHSCNGDVCVTGGTFMSADGRLVEKNLLGVYSWQDGEVHKAIYDSESVDVIPLPTHWDPTATIAGMAGAFGFLVIWCWFLYSAMRRRLLARHEQWDVSALN